MSGLPALEDSVGAGKEGACNESRTCVDGAKTVVRTSTQRTPLGPRWLSCIEMGVPNSEVDAAVCG